MTRIPAAVNRIRSTRPFAACTDADLLVLADNSYEHHARPGDVLIREGGVGREWLVIASGQAVVRVGDRVVARLGPGDAAGEVALLDHGDRTASVVAETEVEAVVASKDEFHRIISSAPTVTRALLGSLARRLRDVDALVAPAT